jgi:hypothetical protein
MYPYEYCVSLRVTHPSIDPNEISLQLGISPFRKWRAGEQRTSTKGEILTGTHNDSFWGGYTHTQKHLDSEVKPLEQHLQDIVEQLNSKRDYLQSIVQSGGYIECFIGIFSESNCSLSISQSIMSELAKSKIALGFDIYPK